MISASATQFTGNPSGSGLPIVDPKTFGSVQEQSAAMKQARIEFNHFK